MKRSWTYKIFAVCLLSLLTFPLQAQDTEETQETSETNTEEQTQEEGESMGEKLQLYKKVMGEWVNLFAGTYAGEFNAQATSLTNQLADGAGEQLEEGGMDADMTDLKTILEELNGSGGRVEAATREFVSRTGVKVYLTGLMSGYPADNKIVNLFNRLSEEKHGDKVAPYLEVVITMSSGADVEDHTLSFELNPSPEVNLTDMSITAEDFSSLLENQSFASAGEVRVALKDLFPISLSNVADKIGTERFAPPLSFMFDNTRYRHGDKISVNQAPGEEIEITVVNQQGNTPDRQVDWTVMPEDTLTFTEGNYLSLPREEPILWEVTAKAGRDEAKIEVDVVQVPTDWKEILKLVLKEVIEELLDKADEGLTELQQQMAQKGQESNKLAQEMNAKLTGYELEFGQIEVEEVSTVQEGFVLEGAIPKNSKFQQALQKYGEYIDLAASDKLKEARKLALLALLNKDQFNSTIKKIEADLPELAAGLTAKLINGEGKEELKIFMMDYINSLLDEMITEALGEDGGELYMMIQSGASREDIKAWISDKLMAVIDKKLEKK